MIGLRQGLLAAAGREKFISALESNVGEGILRTLRGLLWLKDQQKTTAATIVLGEIEKLLGKKLTGLQNALDVNGHRGGDEFDALYKDVETLQRYADAM